MANKRMFTMHICDSDAFLDMPLSTQCLYFHLNMRADDDGFIDNYKRVMRLIGASEDDLKILIAKNFLLTFDNGLIVIKHWRMHNTLSSGRYHETQYIDEKSMLLLKDNGSYSFTSGKPIDDTHNIALGKRQSTRQIECRRTSDEQVTDSDKGLDIGLDKELDIYNIPISLTDKKNQKEKKGFVKPTLEECQTYADEKGYTFDVQQFYDYFDSADWHDSKGQKVRSWKQRMTTWSGRNKTSVNNPRPAEKIVLDDKEKVLANQICKIYGKNGREKDVASDLSHWLQGFSRNTWLDKLTVMYYAVDSYMDAYLDSINPSDVDYKYLKKFSNFIADENSGARRLEFFKNKTYDDYLAELDEVNKVADIMREIREGRRE